MPFYIWSKTFAGNATADSNINFAEGQSPSSLNDSCRAVMGVLAQDRDDISGLLVAGGTSTALTLATNQGYGGTPQAGMRVGFTPSVNNGATVTIAVDSIAAKPLRSAPGIELGGGALTAGTPYVATYFTTNGGEWILHSAPSTLFTNVANVTGSRSVGTIFTNSTGKPIFVSIAGTTSGPNVNMAFTINGLSASQFSENIVAVCSLYGMVPPGATYQLSALGGSFTLSIWTETT